MKKKESNVICGGMQNDITDNFKEWMREAEEELKKSEKKD